VKSARAREKVFLTKRAEMVRPGKTLLSVDETAILLGQSRSSIYRHRPR